MTETKKPTSPRAGRKKTRSKTDNAEASAPHKKGETVEETLTTTEQTLEAEAPAEPEALDRRPKAPPRAPEKSEEELDETEPRQPSVPSGNKSNRADFSERSSSGGGSPEGSRREREGQRANPPKNRLADEYLLQLVFDKQQKLYCATYLEFPDLKSTGPNRDGVARDIENKLENHLQNLKRKNSPLPDSFQSRRYPEKVEVRLSQTLQKRLDQMARHEKVGIEQLISELLTSATLERKAESNQQRSQQSGRHGGQPQSGNRQQSQHGHGQNRRQHQTRYAPDAMDNRENFMEYVRNLEKGNLRKK